MWSMECIECFDLYELFPTPPFLVSKIHPPRKIGAEDGFSRLPLSFQLGETLEGKRENSVCLEESEHRDSDMCLPLSLLIFRRSSKYYVVFFMCSSQSKGSRQTYTGHSVNHYCEGQQHIIHNGISPLEGVQSLARDLMTLKHSSLDTPRVPAIIDDI